MTYRLAEDPLLKQIVVEKEAIIPMSRKISEVTTKPILLNFYYVHKFIQQDIDKDGWCGYWLQQNVSKNVFFFFIIIILYFILTLFFYPHFMYYKMRK
jgi:membrane protein YdbS with pleckstrin-like domain